MSKKNKDDNKVKKPVKDKTKLKRELGFTDIMLATILPLRSRDRPA